ncbi:MAG: hypothetical protein RIC55_21125 [Pirellulaceae bacterium]
MQLICLAGLTMCACSAPGYLAERHFVIDQPYEYVVARLTPEKNQRKIYLACDAQLGEVEQESMHFFPFPLRIGRRVHYCLQLPLCRTALESVEKIQLSGKEMTVECRLARGNWKVRQLDVKIVLRRDGERTRVSTYASMQVNGLGRRLGYLLSDATLQRLESGLRWASRDETACNRASR